MVWSLPVVALAVAFVPLLGPSTASPVPQKGIPVPLGFWFGKNTYKERKAQIGGVDVTTTKGEADISMLSTYDATGFSVFGALDISLRATGELKVNGFEGVGNFVITGHFELGDLPDAIYADGSYRMKGVVVVDANGFTTDVPYDHVFAVTGPITVTDETCTKIKGVLPAGIGGYPWTAKLIAAIAPCK